MHFFAFILEELAFLVVETVSHLKFTQDLMVEILAINRHPADPMIDTFN